MILNNMKKIIIPIIFLLTCLSFLKVFSQTAILISGKVTDKAEKQAIPGVSVSSGNITRTTDGDGVYTISVVPGATIKFSNVGYLTQTFKVPAGQNKLNVVLVEDNKALNEVVVRGYVSRAKEISSGSSTVITAKDLADQPVTNVEQLLQGKVAGLNIQNNTGAPGFRGSVQIRGLSTMTIGGSGGDSFLESASPLYIIDGVPLDADQASEMGFETPGPGVSPISLIPPEDIQSIEILKDAQATSLYGSRGAYGVIIITTKRGNSPVPRVRYSVQAFVSSPPKLRSTLGGVYERNFKIQQVLNNALNPDDIRRLGTTAFLSDSLNKYYDNSTDWQSIFYQTTYNQTHNLSVDGGDPNLFNYKANFSYYSQKGIIKNTGFNRYSTSMNMEYKPSSKFRFFGSLFGALGKTQKGDGLGILQTGVASNGQASSLLPEPSFFQSSAGVLSALQTDNDATSRNLRVNIDSRYQLLEGLNLGSSLSYDYYSDGEDTFTPAIANNSFTRVKGYAGRRSTLYNRNSLQYAKTIGTDHDFFINFFNEFSKQTGQSGIIQQERTPNDQIQGPFGYGAFNSSGGGVLPGYKDVRLASYSGAFSYNYKRKYILDLTYRLDGSSSSGINNRYAKNPSIGLRWNFQKEAFLEKYSWLNAGSLRLSWGKTISPKGNLESIFGRYDINGNYNDNQTIAINYDRIPNPLLKPTTTLQYNLGFDLSVLNNRIDFTFDTYFKKVDNMVTDRFLSDISGFTKVSSNDAAIINYGYEFAVNLRPSNPNSNFNISFNLNAAINRDVLARLPEEYHGQLINRDSDPNSLQHVVLRVGRNTLSNYLRINQGTYSKDSDVPFDPVTSLRYQTNGRFFQAGDPNLLDVNGDYILDDNDYLISGNSQPLFVGGFSFNAVAYKRFQLNVYASYTVGRTILNNALSDRLAIMQNPFGLSSVVPLSDVDIWIKPGDVAKYPNPYDYARYGSIQPLRKDQTLWAESGSYLKINNVTLAYNFNKEKIRRFGLYNLRVHFSTNNVITFSKYTGPNPENVNSLGRDNSNGYPVPRTYTIGLNMELANGQ